MIGKKKKLNCGLKMIVIYSGSICTIKDWDRERISLYYEMTEIRREDQIDP